jgi:hypothetical protein
VTRLQQLCLGSMIMALTGCAPVVLKGTSVGNPGLTAARLAAADGLTLQTARLSLAGLDGIGCDGADVLLASGLSLDLLAPAFVQLPATPLCGLRVRPAAPLNVEGVDAAGGAFLVSLDLTAIQVDGLTSTDGVPSVLELGTPGWLSAATLVDGYVITPSDDRHAVLVDAITRGSALYPDPDGDGAVGEAERAAPLASASGDDDSGDDDADEDPDDDAKRASDGADRGEDDTAAEGSAR